MILTKNQSIGMLQQSKASNHWDAKKTNTDNFKTQTAVAGTVALEMKTITTPLNLINANFNGNEQNRVYVDKLSEPKKIGFSTYAHKKQLAMHLAAILPIVTEYKTKDAECVEGGAIIAIADTSGLRAGQTVQMLDGETVVTFEGETSVTILSVSTNVSITVSYNADDTITGTLRILDYPKEFSPNDGLLDYSNNAGYLYSVAFTDDIANSGIIFHNSIAESASFAIDNMANNDDRLLKEDIKFISSDVSTSQNFTGTWVAEYLPVNNYSYTNLKLDLTYNGTTYSNICYKSFKLDITKTVVGECKVNGITKGYVIQWAITATIALQGSDTNKAIFNSYAGGNNVCTFQLTDDFSKDGYVDGSISINCPAGRLASDSDIKASSDNKEDLNLTINFERPAAGWTPIIVMADSILGGY